MASLSSSRDTSESDGLLVYESADPCKERKIINKMMDRMHKEAKHGGKIIQGQAFIFNSLSKLYFIYEVGLFLLSDRIAH